MNNEPEDDLLKSLGGIAAEEERLSADDRELELMCAGDLPADRIRALELRAARDPELARRMDAYRPLTPDSRAKISAAVVHAVTVSAGSRIPVSAPSDPAPDRSIGQAPRTRARATNALRWTTTVLAVAAGTVLWLNHRTPPADRAAPLPVYALEVIGGVQEQRGRGAPDSHPIRLLPDSRLELVLRPATAVRDRIAVDSFLVPAEAGGTGGGAAIEPAAIPFETSPDGAARAHGTAASLFGARRGHWQLRLIVKTADAPAGNVLRRARLEGGAGPPDAGRADVDLWLLDAP